MERVPKDWPFQMPHEDIKILLHLFSSPRHRCSVRLHLGIRRINWILISRIFGRWRLVAPGFGTGINDQLFHRPLGDIKSFLQSLFIVEMSRFQWGYFSGFLEIEKLQPANFKQRLSPTEWFEIAVGGLALPDGLRGYQKSSSIFLGSGDFGPFPRSSLRRVLGLPAILHSRRQDVVVEL